MSKIMDEIIRCIEQDDKFREKYYDDIDRLDEQENALVTPRRMPYINFYTPLKPEKPHVKNISS